MTLAAGRLDPAGKGRLQDLYTMSDDPTVAAEAMNLLIKNYRLRVLLYTGACN